MITLRSIKGTALTHNEMDDNFTSLVTNYTTETISGSKTFAKPITGSLNGTASYALNTLSASYAFYSTTASYALNASANLSSYVSKSGYENISGSLTVKGGNTGDVLVIRHGDTFFAESGINIIAEDTSSLNYIKWTNVNYGNGFRLGTTGGTFYNSVPFSISNPLGVVIEVSREEYSVTFRGGITGSTAVFSGSVKVSDEIYGSGWSGSLEVPTKNAIYNKIQTISSSSSTSSGTYTPTLTNGTNVSGSTAQICNYIRVDNQVIVHGSLLVEPTAGSSTNTVIDVSLPIASNFVASGNLNGQSNGNGDSYAKTGVISADYTNDTAEIQFPATNTGSQYQIWFSFMYTVQ